MANIVKIDDVTYSNTINKSSNKLAILILCWSECECCSTLKEFAVAWHNIPKVYWAEYGEDTKTTFQELAQRFSFNDVPQIFIIRKDGALQIADIYEIDVGRNTGQEIAKLRSNFAIWSRIN